MICLLLSSIFFTHAYAQTGKWGLDECMAYAVENSTKVKTQDLTNDNYRQSKNAALASFFPSASAGVGGSANFGRSIDPETNIYTNVTNFGNSYSVSSSMPVFSGLANINTYKASKVAVMMGKEELEQIKDQVALETMEAYFQVIYYSKAAEYAGEQLEASRTNYTKSLRLEELGMQSRAEVLQLEAQVASDDYTLTQQENNRDMALITLKEKMNYPVEEELDIDTEVMIESAVLDNPVHEIISYASSNNPRVKAAEYSLRQAELNYAASKGYLYPSISLSGNFSTGYAYNPDYVPQNATDRQTPFMQQLKDKQGYYVGASLSIPIFDGLYRRANANRQRNNMRIAEQSKISVERTLQSEIEQNYRQMQGYGKEYIQATKKVEAATLAHKAVIQKYDQGLISAFDLQTSANRVLESQSQQLNARLQYIIKCRLMEYYKGEPLIR